MTPPTHTHTGMSTTVWPAKATVVAAGRSCGWLGW